MNVLKKTKRALAWLLASSMMLSTLAGTTFFTVGADELEEDPSIGEWVWDGDYSEIDTAEEFVQFATAVNNAEYADAVTVTADLDFTGLTYKPIDNLSFTIDLGGHTLSNMNVALVADDFGTNWHTTYAGMVANFLTGDGKIMNGTFKDCSLTVDALNTYVELGGIAGISDRGYISGINLDNFTIDTNTSGRVGGLLGCYMWNSNHDKTISGNIDLAVNAPLASVGLLIGHVNDGEKAEIDLANITADLKVLGSANVPTSTTYWASGNPNTSISSVNTKTVDVYVNNADNIKVVLETIDTPYELALLAEATNTYGENYRRGETILVTADLDMKCTSYTPYRDAMFVVDFQGHTVSNLNVSTNTTYAGLIAESLSNGGAIKDIVLENCSLYDRASGGYAHMGAVAGYANRGYVTSTTLKNVTITLSGSGIVGGVIGVKQYDCFQSATGMKVVMDNVKIDAPSADAIGLVAARRGDDAIINITALDLKNVTINAKDGLTITDTTYVGAGQENNATAEQIKLADGVIPNVQFTTDASGYAEPENAGVHGEAVENASSAIAATCTRPGKEADKVCPVCGIVLEEGATIEATGRHDNTEIVGKVEPTFDSEGYTGDEVCSDCGEYLTIGSVISAATKFEAEDAELTSGITDIRNGNGITTVWGVDNEKVPQSITFKVNTTKPGDYDLIVAGSNSGDPRAVRVTVNNKTSFDVSVGWTDNAWGKGDAVKSAEYVIEGITLEEGVNEIVISRSSLTTYAPGIDYINLVQHTYEAEDPQESNNTSVNDTNVGWLGNTGLPNGTGESYVQYTINSASAGFKVISLNYTATAQDRGFEVTVNGAAKPIYVSVQNIASPVTVTAYFKAGENTIKIGNTTSRWCPDFDSFTITASDVDAVAYDESYAPVTANDLATKLAAGAQITMIKDATVGDLALNNNATLDLNGYTLEATSVMAAAGSNVVDNSADKAGRLKASYLALDPDNAQMPVMTNTGYAFATMKMDQYVVSEIDGGYKLVFRPSFGKEFNTLVNSEYVDVFVVINWTENEGDPLELTYAEDLISEVYTNTKAFSLKVTGVEDITGLTATICVNTHGVEASTAAIALQTVVAE